MKAREYDFYDYIGATGKQFVRTGYVPGSNTTVDFDFVSGGSFAEGSTYFGCAWAANAWLFCSAASSFYFFGTTTQLLPFAAERHLHLSLGADNIARLTDGDTGDLLAAKSTSRQGNGQELGVFGLGTSRNKSACRFHSLKMKEGEVVKLDLVPAKKRSTGEVGLLDLASGRMLLNETTTPFVVGTVTNDSLSRLIVAVDGAATNETLAISGNIRLVKEGRGSLTVARLGQTYAGGTLVAEGALDMVFDPSATAAYSAARGLLGAADSEIAVEKGGLFDYKGNDGLVRHPIALNGGTVRNGGVDASTSSAGVGEMRLGADARFELAADATFKDGVSHTIDLGGHTYAIATGEKTFRVMSEAVVTTGRVEVTGQGLFEVSGSIKAKNADFSVGCSLSLAGTMDVRDYIHTAASAANAGNGTLNVFGVFKPVTDSFYGCVMQDGSTIDLSGREGAWSLDSQSAGGCRTVSFVQGGTVTIDLGSRQPTGKILSWTQPPQGVAFDIKGENAAGCSFREDGIYAADGLRILLK